MMDESLPSASVGAVVVRVGPAGPLGLTQGLSQMRCSNGHPKRDTFFGLYDFFSLDKLIVVLVCYTLFRKNSPFPCYSTEISHAFH